MPVSHSQELSAGESLGSPINNPRFSTRSDPYPRYFTEQTFSCSRTSPPEDARVPTFIQDLRYALRQMRLAPAFTLTAILTLAIGIGATTAIFTLVHAIMLKSQPVTDPAQLYRIGDAQECCVVGWEDDDWSLFSYQLYQRLAAAAPEFEEITAFQAAPTPTEFVVRSGTTKRGHFALSSLAAITSTSSGW